MPAQCGDQIKKKHSFFFIDWKQFCFWWINLIFVLLERYMSVLFENERLVPKSGFSDPCHRPKVGAFSISAPKSVHFSEIWCQSRQITQFTLPDIPTTSLCVGINMDVLYTRICGSSKIVQKFFKNFSKIFQKFLKIFCTIFDGLKYECRVKSGWWQSINGSRERSGG